MTTFTIDFFELCFLAEACIPPSPIARSMMWSSLIDKHHNAMTKDERERMYEIVTRHYSFKQGIENNNEDCIIFEKRFNPNNQYLIHTNMGGVDSTHLAFEMNGRYCTSTRSSIISDYITLVERA